MIKMKNEYYINQTEMTYYTILSQGMGKIHPKLSQMFLLLIEKMMYKTSAYMNYDDKNDSRNNAYIKLALKYKNFDYKKYDNAFNYFSEVLKRSLAESYNTNVYRIDKATQKKHRFISLANIYY